MPKIPALPIASSASTGDLLVLDQGNVVKRIDFNVMQSAIANAGTVQSLIAQGVQLATQTTGFASNVIYKPVGVGSVQRSVAKKLGDTVNAADYGFDPNNSDVQNSTALQAAVDAGFGTVQMNQGTYNFTGLTIHEPIILKGAGALTTNGAPSNNGTYLNYTGVGVAIVVGDSAGADKEGYHLRDFVLTGNNSATNGIQVGVSAGHWFLKSSIKRVFVRGFSKNGAAGFVFAACLSSTFEQCYAQNNFLGFNAVGETTNSIFSNCYARTNTSVGWTLQDITQSTFISCLSEANGDAGLELRTSGCGSLLFLNWYNTDNNSSAGSSPVNIGMSGAGSVVGVDFKGGYFQNANVGNVQFKIDKATAVFFDNPTITSANTGWMTVTANTVSCEFRSRNYPSLLLTDISGWTPQRLRVDVESITWTPAYSGTTGVLGSYNASLSKGYYGIIADECGFSAQLALSSRGGWTGTAQLSLPPFTVRAGGPVVAGPLIIGGVSLTGNGCSLYMATSGQLALIEENGVASGATTDLLGSAVTNNATFIYSGRFKI